MLWDIKTPGIPVNTRIKIDYAGRQDGQPVYVALALKGVSTDRPEWSIMKLFYDSSDNFIDRKFAEGSYDGRSSLTYS